MKKLLALFFAIIILSAITMTGREYEPTLVNGRTWVISTEVFIGYNEWHFPEYAKVRGYIEIQNDTIVNGLPCKIMSYRLDIDGYDKTFLAREDCQTRKLYSGLGTCDTLLYPTYDFSAKVNEKLETFTYDGLLRPFEGYSQYITNDDLIRVRGKEWHRLTIDNNGYWVEGIGSPGNTAQLTDFIQSGPGPSSSLIEVQQDGEVIFTAEDFNAEPCGVDDVVVETEAEGPIYDTMGRQVETPQPGQLYIRNGRKFIARP